jgi:hypothetical protein
LGVFGLITNSISAFIFAIILMKERQKSNMFRYFFVKSINDLIYVFTLQIRWFQMSYSIKHSYLFNFFDIFIYWYSSEAVVLASSLLELIATIDCYNLLSKKIEFLTTKKCFYFVVFSIYAICLSVPILFLIKWKIVRSSNGDYVKVEKTQKLNWIFFFIFVFVRDNVILIIIITFNILILFKMKNLTRNRRIVSDNNQTMLVIQAQKAERNKVKMIVSVSLNFFIFHFPNDLRNFYSGFTSDSSCFDIIISVLFDLPYYNSIVFFMLFNVTFKKTFIEYFTFKKLTRNRVNVQN